MNQKPLIFRPSIVFSSFVLLAALSFGAFAQEKTQNEAAEESDCKADAAKCAQIKKFTENYKSKKQTDNFSDYQFYRYRAHRYAEIGELSLAISDISKCIDLQPNSDDFVFRGNLYIRKGKYDDAFQDFNSVITRNRNVAAAYLGRGKVFYFKREYDSAFDDLERALQLNARLSEAYYYRSLIYTIRGEDEKSEKSDESIRKAIQDYTSVIEIDLRKADPDVYLKRAKLYEAIGNEIEAEADRQTYRELTKKP